MSITRRNFVKGSLLGLGIYAAGMNLPVWAQQGLLESIGSAIRDAVTPDSGLLPPDDNGLMLPPGFTSRVIAVSGSPPSAGSPYLWHPAPDGGAIFPLSDGGWIYVSNSEVPGEGGCGALRFDSNGQLIDAYPILTHTQWNCAGGATPWGTWLSCEEFPYGRVWECDPMGQKKPEPLEGLGVFKHEAAAVDTETLAIYLTEDQPDGLFYRFTATDLQANGVPDMNKGLLEAALVGADGRVEWRPVPRPLLGEDDPARRQVPGATPFNGGEGAVYKDGMIYFATKGDDKIWAYDARAHVMSVLYDPSNFGGPPVLSGVDNIVVMPGGNLAVAEDGGNMELVGLDAQGKPRALLRLTGHDNSEIAGPAFTPDGKRLYFASQRGVTGNNEDGMIFEVSGDFSAL